MFSRSIAASIAIAGGRRAGCVREQQQQRQGHEGGLVACDSKGATAIKPGKRGGKLTVLASADVDYLDPGQTYYTFGYMVQYAVNRTLYSFKPDNSEKPVPDLATGPPEISADNKTITVHIKPGVKYAPPVNREVKTRTSSTPSSARSPRRCPAATPAPISARSSARPKANTGDDQADLGHRDARRHDDRLPAEDAQRAARLAGAGDADHDAGAQEYAAPFDRSRRRRTTSTSPSPAPTWSRTTEDRQGDRPRAGQVDRHRPQPQLGQVDRLPARLPGRDRSRRATTTWRPPRAAPWRARPRSAATRPAAGPGPQAGAPARQGPGALRAGRRRALHLVQHHRQAVRQHQHPQGDHRRLRSRGAAPDARRRGVGPHRQRLAAARLPGFEEAGGPKQDADLDYLENPKGDPAVAKKYMLAAKQQDPSLPIDANGKWTGGEKVLTIAEQRRSGQEDGRGLPEPDGAARVQAQPAPGPEDTLYTKFCGVPRRTSRSARTSAGSGTSPTRSRCSTRRSTATTSSSRATSTGPSSTIPAINAAMKAPP